MSKVFSRDFFCICYARATQRGFWILDIKVHMPKKIRHWIGLVWKVSCIYLFWIPKFNSASKWSYPFMLSMDSDLLLLRGRKLLRRPLPLPVLLPALLPESLVLEDSVSALVTSIKISLLLFDELFMTVEDTIAGCFCWIWTKIVLNESNFESGVSLIIKSSHA